MITYTANIITDTSISGIKALLGAEHIDVLYIHSSKQHYIYVRFYRRGEVSATRIEDRTLREVTKDQFDKVASYCDTTFVEQVLDTVDFPRMDSFIYREMDYSTRQQIYELTDN